MKRQLSLSLFILSFIISFVSSAQNKGKARYISSKGYWVIENNIKAPKSNTIYFYNNENVLVYHEKVEGVNINIDRRKTLLKLKSIMEQAVVAWEKGERKSSNTMLAVAFKK